MDKYAVCDQAFFAVRINPDDRAEMVTQILFGELYEIVDRQNNWLNVVSLIDQYQGWIFVRQACIVSSQYVVDYNKVTPVHSTNLFQQVLSTKRQLIIGIGSRLPFYFENNFNIGLEAFSRNDSSGCISQAIPDSELLIILKSLLETPYLWGGRSSFGIDCSGLVQLIMNFKALKMPRDASMQYKIGIDIIPEDVQLFDLAFFGDQPDKVTHVGILIDKNQIIHASGKVRTDFFDSNGILNTSIGSYTHKLIGIKRVFNT